MSRVTELLDRIVELIQHYNSEEWQQVSLNPGLSLDQIQHCLEGYSFTLPTEIIELYQWRNGTACGSFFISAEAAYSDREFYPLDVGLEQGEEWSQGYCPDRHLLVLFGFDGAHYWTVLPETQQELAPIYSNDEANFDVSPDRPSLAAMLEKLIDRLKFAWKID